MSEIMNIPLGGVSNEPNDYSSEDGAMSLSLNAVKHHGSIRPVMPGSPVADIGEDGLLLERTDVVAIHEVGGMKHYIVVEEAKEEAGSAIMPDARYITIYYECKKSKVEIWWNGNIAKKGMSLYLNVGVGSSKQQWQISYGYKTTVPSASIIVGQETNPDGSVSPIMYDYNDPSKHPTKESFEVIRVYDHNERTEVNYGKAEFLKVGTKVNITIQCLPGQIRMGYKAESYQHIGSVIMKIGTGSRSKAIGILDGIVYDYKNPEADLSVGSTTGADGSTVDVMYSHPSSVLTQENVKVSYMLDKEGAEISMEYFNVSVNIATLEEQTDIETGSSILMPEAGSRYTLRYIDANSDDKTSTLIAPLEKNILGVSTIGNVLIVSAKDEPLNYIIWKDGKYHVLGSEAKAPKVYPYLLSSIKDITDIVDTYGIDYAPEERSTQLWKEEVIGEAQWKLLTNGEASFFSFMADQQKYVSDKVFAIVNSAHKEFSRKGYFWAPFYVRCALRLYDGTHIMHTPPQLMIAGSGGKPVLYVDINTESKSATLNPAFVLSQLCLDIQGYANTWGDLISSLDVFVSPPLTNYTDATDSISGAAVILAAPEDESEEAVTNKLLDQGAIMLDDIYMKSRKQMASVAKDFVSVGNYSRFVTLTSVGIKSNKPVALRNNAQKGRELYGTFYLFSKSRYPNLRVTDVYGNQKQLKDATADTQIAYISKTLTESGEEEKITLADTGLTDLDKYWYLEVPATKYYETYIIHHKDDSLLEQNITSEVRAIRVWSRSGDQITKLVKDGGSYALKLNRTDGQNYKDILQDNNIFHLVHSIPIKELAQGWEGLLPIGQNILDSLDSRQTLPDNGQMRSKATVSILPYAYNNRLSMVTEKWEMPSTSSLADLCVQNDPDEDKEYYIEKAWIKGIVNNQEIYKQLNIGLDNDRYTYAENIRYFYYPCHEATELIMQIYSTVTGETHPHMVHTYSLSKHKLLNGAYCFNNFNSLVATKTATYASRDEMEKDETLSKAMEGAAEAIYGNMVRVSGVSNPFYFNEVNQVQLPSGKISGLSTTAKALSQGQFGAFPLYCFSDNGIWALEVSDTGTYSAKQPVSRAVCTNPESITQTEGSVLFVTKRGLMALDGSSVTCVSEALSGHNYTSALSKLDKVKELAGLQDVPNPDTHIEEWLQDARLLYDDKRQMIYAFNDEDVLGYVYSISDQAWGMMVHDLAHPLPCYTDALAVTREDGNGRRRLVNMSDHTGCGEAPKAVLVTRPLTFGSADAFKSIEALTLRGMLDKDDAKLVIWASNDLKHWAVAASSQTLWYRGKSGTPYKYYRIGIVLEWEEEDSLNAIGADITTRLTNRIR